MNHGLLMRAGATASWLLSRATGMAGRMHLMLLTGCARELNITQSSGRGLLCNVNSEGERELYGSLLHMQRAE